MIPLIAQGADDIQGLLTFQVRRMNAAFDEATSGQSNPQIRAAS